MDQDTDSTIDDFIERLGLIAQADGLPRIAGRVMGLLVIHGGPLSFAELGEKLKANRGSISTNTRLLENLGIIERVTRSGERQDYFRLAPTPIRNYYTVELIVSPRPRKLSQKQVKNYLKNGLIHSCA